MLVPAWSFWRVSRSSPAAAAPPFLVELEGVTVRDAAPPVAAALDAPSLDDIFAEHNPDRIDLIKIDVEGSEADVLAGARETLWAYRPKLVIEWNNHFFTDRPEAAEALYTLITRDLRYSLHRIEPGATTRPIGHAELMEGFHDLVAEPPE